jgi:hypothetical protein
VASQTCKVLKEKQCHYLLPPIHPLVHRGNGKPGDIEFEISFTFIANNDLHIILRYKFQEVQNSSQSYVAPKTQPRNKAMAKSRP